MKIFQKTNKSIPGFGYWGNFGEIDVGISSGSISDNQSYRPEPLHHHQQGTTYFICLDGVGLIEVNGREIKLEKDQVLCINPQEKYRVVGAVNFPFEWLVFCTIKDPQDKIVDI
jgi:mannose-6-phosphate isomerase-like protein (cupin superfamily)